MKDSYSKSDQGDQIRPQNERDLRTRALADWESRERPLVNGGASVDAQADGHAPRISAVMEVTGRTNWLSVQFDDQSELQVTLRDWADFGLKVGQSIPAFMRRELEQRSVEAAAYEVALRYLKRSHTEAEVRQYLRQKGYNQAAVDSALKRLKTVGAIDDEAYVARFVEVKAHRMSRREMSWRLRQKGIQSRELTPYVDADRVRQAEQDACQELARRYWRRIKDSDAQVRVRKLAAYLNRRGFPVDVSRIAIRAILAEADQSATDFDTDWTE
ncbi:MAG: recombination regulator RecX [Alicyclobacillus herbarius]|uniref:regulatory protein RecX n=1 Tax=Alicyclobacillus herbarius TaxID=122960 RepID=UPI002357420A|nr:regulatory protein RecX [Alicyclobacillus herbarius]MCL6632744.1 recombination regulator RecX [Alicyclobacillus herbarius]